MQAFDDDPGLKIITYNIWFDGGFYKSEETSTSQNNKEPANESLVARGKRLMAIHTYILKQCLLGYVWNKLYISYWTNEPMLFVSKK